MKTTLIRNIFIVGALAAIISAGAASQLFAHADEGITVPGSITNLPQANGVIYEAPLVVTAQIVTPRQALDAAEAEFGLTDSQIDINARAVPVVVSVGLSPALQHMKAWVVTANTDLESAGGPGIPATVTHKMCIIIGATTGRYIMAYAAGPRFAVNP